MPSLARKERPAPASIPAVGLRSPGLLSLVFLVACGGGSSESAPSAQAPSPRPAPVATAGPTAVPVGTPVPTEVPIPPLALAVGGIFYQELPGNTRGALPRILRNVDGTWEEVVLSDEIQRGLVREPDTLANGNHALLLTRIFFRSRTEAWVVANGAGAGGFGTQLLRTQDRGQTWENATSLLPAPFRYVPRPAIDSFGLNVWDVVFEDDDTWWIAGGGSTGILGHGPELWRTNDGGTSWEPILQIDDLRLAEWPIHLDFLQVDPLLLYSWKPSEGVSLLGTDPEAATPVEPRFVPRDVEVAWDQVWAVSGGPEPHVSIDGQTWSELPIERRTEDREGVRPELLVLDVGAGPNGIACGGRGASLTPGGGPFCAFTRDEGETWTESTFSGNVSWIRDVAFADPQTVWALGWVYVGFSGDEVHTFRLFLSTDGGASFDLFETGFEGDAGVIGQIGLVSIASSP